MQLSKELNGVPVSSRNQNTVSTACSHFLDWLSDRMIMIGVTGTNGKTTTTFMIKEVLEANGIKTGLIGTVEAKAGDETLCESILTTPPPMKLCDLLRQMWSSGCKAVVMEVSSEGLARGRVAGIHFNVGVFTNLTHDHLDVHRTMENYATEKRKLFAQCKAAVLNADSEYSAFMAKGFSGPVLTYGIHFPSDVCADNVSCSDDRISYTLRTSQGSIPVEIPVPGMFNVYNSLACVSTCLLLDMQVKDIVSGMLAIQPVPGRIERIHTPGLPFSVIIDFAHSPDAIENILNTVSDFTRGRIITVFGCAGNRDKTKRPEMGYIAGRLSDFCILTSDNPQYEEPDAIVQDILPGMMKSGCKFEVEENRSVAIEKAMHFARAGDTIVLAGKGHEKYQLIRGARHPFDEKAIVYEVATKMIQR